MIAELLEHTSKELVDMYNQTTEKDTLCDVVAYSYATYKILTDKQRTILANHLMKSNKGGNVENHKTAIAEYNIVTTKKVVDIYTDGACTGNPGKGGWGAVLVFGDKVKEISGHADLATNNEMELTAVIEGLKALKEPCSVRVYSDSAYIVNSINLGWLDNWQRLGWKTSTNTDVANQEMWLSILELMKKHDVEFVKVKGHAGNKYNEMADALAVKAKFTKSRKAGG